MKKTTSAIALLLLLLLPTLSFRAQSGEATSEEAAGEEALLEPHVEFVDVDIVNVDTYVVDKDGNPVRGLTADDFELYEDDRPVKILNFYAVEDGKSVLPPDEVAAEAAETAARELPPVELEPLELPEDQRLRVIIFFDNLFLRPFNRNRVIAQVRGFLRSQLGPDDLVMLVSFDRTLNIRHPFTTNRQAIADEMFELEELSGFGVQGDADRRDIIRRIQRAEDALDAEGHVDFYAKNRYNDLTMSLRALSELVGSLAGLPGRKALLHVSDGLPMVPGRDLFQLLDSTFQDQLSGVLLSANRYSAKRQFRELTAKANANRVTFYTVEAAGLRSHESLSAENPGTGDRLGGGSLIDTDFARVMNTTESLQLMAYETGGQATFSSNNIAGALERMAQDFKNYYSLGYAPASANDGRYHSIEVKVKGKGYEVRHRRGFRGRSAESQVNDSTIASLLYGIESNPLGIKLAVDVDGARVQEGGNYLVPLQVRIPLGKVALLPREGNHLGRVRVSVAVVDEEGNLSPVEQTRVPISIPDADIAIAREQFFVYEVQLLMRKGNQRVAIGVRDDYAGETSFVRYPVRI